MEASATAKPLTSYIGKTFLKERFGHRVAVILKEVRRTKVVIQEPGRADSSTIPLERFIKYYRRP